MKLIDILKTYEGKFLTYYIASYKLNDGSIKKYEFMSRNHNLTVESFGSISPKGVGIVAFNSDLSKVLLLKEFRLACNNYVYNFCGGLIDKGEDAFIAAKRELKEETGLDLIEYLDHLKPSYALQATSDELMETIVARCDGEIKDSCFIEEEIEAKWFTKEEVLSLINSGALMSARTQLSLYFWAKGTFENE